MFTVNRKVLWAAAAACVACLAIAMYLQLVKQMYPCPLCIIARYVFIGVASLAILAALAPRACQHWGALLAGLTALGGVGLGLYHQWVLAHPLDSCGIDPTKTMLNKLFTAEWFPNVFYASGMCSDLYPSFFGLQIPMWSLLSFIALSLVLLRVAARRG